MATLDVPTRSISLQEWETHRNELHRLYITENRQLRDVMICTHKKNFVATRRQYTKQFAKWGESFIKNIRRQDVEGLLKPGTKDGNPKIKGTLKWKRHRNEATDNPGSTEVDGHPLTLESSGSLSKDASSFSGSTPASVEKNDASSPVTTNVLSAPFLPYRNFDWAVDQVNIRNLLCQHVQWLHVFYRRGSKTSPWPAQVTPWDITQSDWRALLATWILMDISSPDDSQSPPVSAVALPQGPRVLFECICMIMEVTKIQDIITARALVLLGVLRKKRSPVIDLIPNRLVLFVAALMLSQKTLDDSPYPNATWAKITNIPSGTLFEAELLFLEDMEFRLCRGRTKNWDDETLDFLLYRSSFLEYCLGVHMMNAKFYQSVQLGAQQANLRGHMDALLVKSPFLPLGVTPLSNVPYNDPSILEKNDTGFVENWPLFALETL